MNNALILGPFALPYSLLLFSVIATSIYVANRDGRKTAVEVEPVLWKTLLVGLVVASMAFFWVFPLAYMASPWDLFETRHGGWNATAGFLGAWLFALSLYRRRPALRRPVQAALLTGAMSG